MKVETKLTILNRYGLHVRPCTRLSEAAKGFRSAITLTTSQGRRADGKSLLQLLGLGLKAGAEITMTAQGDDAEGAIRALSELAANQFGMDYSE